jgi:hypothetical protein
VLERATGNSDSQDSSWPGLGGSHHLPPYSILWSSPQGPHPNGILSRDSQVGVSKFLNLGLSRLWGFIIFSIDLRSIWGLKQSYSPCRKFSNGIWHAICTQGNQVNSWLLVVKSQTIDPSFEHNLCFKCPNESCERILDIYISITFQWYKELLNPLGFDPYNRLLKIWESTGIPISQSGSSLGSVRIYSVTLSFTPRSMRHDSRTSFLACNLATPCLGHKPKARVAIACSATSETVAMPMA